MTEKDKILVEKASKLAYVDHYMIDNMMKEAETPEAKDKLRDIQRILYHKEEYFAGLL